MTTLSQLGATAAKYWWVLLLRGITLIALGIMMQVWPGATVLVFAMLFVAYLIVDGVFTIIQGFTDGQSKTYHLVLGGLSILAAVIILVWPKESATVFVFLVGFWAIVAGVAATAGGLALRKVAGSGWGWMVAWGVLAIIFGLSLILTPTVNGILSLLWIVSVWAIISGITLAMFSFVVRKAGTTLVAGGK